MEKQPVAWEVCCGEYWLEKTRKCMSRWTELPWFKWEIVKNGVKPQSINRSINQSINVLDGVAFDLHSACDRFERLNGRQLWPLFSEYVNKLQVHVARCFLSCSMQCNGLWTVWRLCCIDGRNIAAACFGVGSMRLGSQNVWTNRKLMSSGVDRFQHVDRFQPNCRCSCCVLFLL